MFPASRCQGRMLLTPSLTMLSGHHMGLFRPKVLCLELTLQLNGKHGGMYLAFTSSFSAAATRFCLAASAFACCLTAWCAAALRTSALARSCCDLLTCNASPHCPCLARQLQHEICRRCIRACNPSICGALPHAISYCDCGTVGHG